VLARHPARAQDALLEAARREGSLTWFNGSIGDTVAQDMVGRFERAHPGIRLITIRSTSQVAFQRLRQDQQAGLHNCDIYSSSDISHFDDLAREQRLLAYTPAMAARIDPALQGRQLYVEGQYYPAPPKRRSSGRTCWTRAGRTTSRSVIPASAAMPAPGPC